MTIYEKNVEAFQKRLKGFHFEEYEGPEKGIYDVEKTKNGEFTFKCMNENKSFYAHSRFNPSKEGEDFARGYKTKIEDSNIIVLFGLGFGYGARGFFKYMSPSNMMIIFEPSWYIFELAMKTVDISDILVDERTSFLIGNNFENMETDLNSFININNFQNIVYAQNPFYLRFYEDESKDFAQVLKNVVTERRIGYDTFRSLGTLWTDKMFRNLKHILKSRMFHEFHNIFLNKPIVVVASGPSLDKNVELLKNVQGEFVIICVYTAVRVLIKHGIRPDFVVTLDSQQTIHETDEQKQELFDTPVVYLGIAETSLLDRFTGPKIYCRTPHDIVLRQVLPEKLLNCQSIFVGGSVMVSALHFAHYLGGNPIITIGFNAAFLDEQEYATGAFHYDHKSAPMDIVWLDGIDGGKVKSTIMYEDFIRSTEQLVAQTPETLYIDATEGGAKKKGMQIDTLQHVIEKYQDKNAVDINEALNQIYDKEPIVNNDELELIYKNIKKVKKLTAELEEYFDEGEKFSDDVFKLYTHGKPDEETSSDIVKKYCDLDDKINKIMEQVTIFYGAIERVKFVLRFHQPTQEDQSETYFAKHSYFLYREMNEITKKINAAIDELFLSLEIDISDEDADSMENEHDLGKETV